MFVHIKFNATEHNMADAYTERMSYRIIILMSSLTFAWFTLGGCCKLCVYFCHKHELCRLDQYLFSLLLFMFYFLKQKKANKFNKFLSKKWKQKHFKLIFFFYWSNKYLNHKFIELSMKMIVLFIWTKWEIFFSFILSNFCWLSSFILDICCLYQITFYIIKYDREGCAQKCYFRVGLNVYSCELCIIFVDFQQTTNFLVCCFLWMFTFFNYCDLKTNTRNFLKQNV